MTDTIHHHRNTLKIKPHHILLACLGLLLSASAASECLPHLGHVVQTAHASGYLCHGRSRSVIAGGGLETAPHGVVGAHGFGGVEFGCLQEQFGVFRRYVHVRRVELRGPAEFGAVGRVALVAQVGHSVDEDIGSLAACGVFVP